MSLSTRSSIVLKEALADPTAGAEVVALLAGGLTNSSPTLSGTITVADQANFVFNTSTGTKFGTGTTQKIAFYNASPTAQPAGNTDVLASLVTLGLRAASNNPALNLGTGAITCGALAPGTITLTDTNIVLTNTTGTKIGTSATAQKLAFFNASPVNQPTNAAQTALIDSTGGVADSSTHTLVDVTGTPDQAKINANFATITVLLNRLRADLVTLGLIKGS